VLNPRIRSFAKKFVIAVVATLVGAFVIIYAGDSVVFRYRDSKSRQPLGQVTVVTYYAVGEKGNKTEYIFNPPQAVTCANSIFPHQGYAPCWYLQRHKEQRTDI
jgi:hypothetical protein